MPAATATHSTGMPAEANPIAIKAKLPPGMPGVPMEATVEAKAMAKYWLVVRSMPQQLAINTEATPKYIATPSMLMVAPNESTNRPMSLLTPSFSVHCIV